MKRRNILHVNFTCILSALVCCPIFAQTSWKAEHCRVLANASEPAGPKVIIDDILLGRPTDVVAPVWDQIVSETKRQVFSGGNWVEELKEVTLRGALQNQGYFTPDVAAEAKVVSSSPTLEHVVVQAHVRGGTRYTLSGIQFRGVYPDEHLAFSGEELRSLIPQHDGDIFSVDKVRNGLEALRKHYGSRGYIDFVAAPESEVDEKHQQIALVLLLQEGLQFRLGDIETVGLDARLETELRSTVRSGDVANLRAVADFYLSHKSELPEEVLPEDVQFSRNFKQKTADAFFDFRSCSQLLQN